MTIAQMLLPELDQEMAGTRKMLERVPEGQLDWQPHAKSMRLGTLASHLAELIGWGALTMRTTELDMNPKGGEPWKPAVWATRAEILAAFERNAADLRAAISAASDADFGVPWTLKAGEQVYFTMPRVACLRSMIFNHICHHRGQLTVYFRLLGVSVPGLYGPSADEQ